MKNISGFTLVELIVVMGILSILSTLGFFYYSNYLNGVRDVNRITALNSISDGLNLALATGKLPVPDNSIDIMVDGDIIAKQGYLGTNVLEDIAYSQDGFDPQDKQYYSYYMTPNQKYFQLMAFLEDSSNIAMKTLIPQGFASTNYRSRTPYVFGNKLGILTDINNTPVQELTDTSLEVGPSNTQAYISYLSSTQSITAMDHSQLEEVASVGGRFCQILNESMSCSQTPIDE